MRLRQLDLRDFGAMNAACMAHLRDMPMEVLQLSLVNHVTDGGMAHLQAMSLHDFSLPHSGQVTDEGVAKIPLRFLRHLNL